MSPVGESPHASTRRRFLAATGVATLAVVSLPGCDLLSTDPGNKAAAPRRGRSGEKEAPMLAEQVKSGKLPRLAERLPKDPLTVAPIERAGAYGGELHSAILGVGDV
ncbi:MAG TPA: twin-arginine translocation signal domain-containing protein, partial [Actinopolymorphaceae bacterium]|nr:twin-arginine translocation signal domain-containing protein [Actinopolymorphaceae bacterium]